MAIYIKSLDMPKESILMTVDNESAYVIHEGKSCEVIEVKTPHGRLIDADALKVKFTKTDVSGINLELDRYALKCIENAPTIIEAEG